MFTKNYGMLKLNIIFLPFSICFVLLLTSHSAQRFYLFVVVFFGECFNYFYYDFIRTEILPYLGSQITCGSNFKSDKICIKLSDLDSPLKAYTPRSYLCCQQNVLVWFVSAFRRKKARDKNGKQVPCYTSILLVHKLIRKVNKHVTLRLRLDSIALLLSTTVLGIYLYFRRICFQRF